MSPTTYDAIIVGTGPAGLTAAFYARRLGLSTIVFGDIPGGSTYMIEKIMNFPGFNEGIGGTDFGVKLYQQAQAEGAEFPMTRLTALDHKGGSFLARDSRDTEFSARTAIVAGGRVPIRLPIKNAAMRGVNFCSVCDGPLYRGKAAILAVIGSDNTAAQHALTLARIAARVYLIHRSKQPHMDVIHLNQLNATANVEIRSGTEVTGYKGFDLLEALEVRSGTGNDELAVDGVFMAIGWRPNTGMLAFEVKTNREGYLKTDDRLMTSIEGLFAAGDVRDTDLPQVLTACADGARTARHAARYLEIRI
ncbi:MAG: FAD-dependent oxidoreductase [Desulfobacteraceae bacterium]|nr:FAD-dependent oxidoreductase [Desulfobacteraceae bacterium]